MSHTVNYEFYADGTPVTMLTPAETKQVKDDLDAKIIKDAGLPSGHVTNRASLGGLVKGEQRRRWEAKEPLLLTSGNPEKNESEGSQKSGKQQKAKTKLHIVTVPANPLPKKRKADPTTINFEPDLNIQRVLPAHLQGNLDISGNGRVVQLSSGTFELTSTFKAKAQAEDFWTLLRKKIGQMRDNYKKAEYGIALPKEMELFVKDWGAHLNPTLLAPLSRQLSAEPTGNKDMKLKDFQNLAAALVSSATQFHASINGLKKGEIIDQEIPMQPTGIVKRLLEIPASNISAREHNRHMQIVIDGQAWAGEYLRQDLAAIAAVLSNLAHEVKEDRVLGVFIFDHLLGILDEGTMKAKKVANPPPDGESANQHDTDDEDMGILGKDDSATTTGEELTQSTLGLQELPKIYLSAVLGGHVCRCESCEPDVRKTLMDEAIQIVRREGLAKIDQAELEKIKEGYKAAERSGMKEKAMQELEDELRTEKGRLIRQDAMEQAKKELIPQFEAKYKGEMLEQAEKNAKTAYAKKQLEIATRAAQNAQLLADSLDI